MITPNMHNTMVLLLVYSLMFRASETLLALGHTSSLRLGPLGGPQKHSFEADSTFGGDTTLCGKSVALNCFTPALLQLQQGITFSFVADAAL